MTIELTFTTNDPQIRENTEQLFMLLQNRELQAHQLLPYLSRIHNAELDLGALDGQRHSLLSWAAWNGAAAEGVVCSLLEKAPELLHILDTRGETPVFMAAANGPHVKTLRLLLEAGADIHQNKSGSGVLECGVWSMSVEKVQLLLERGANIDIGVLSMATIRANQAVLGLLLCNGASLPQLKKEIADIRDQPPEVTEAISKHSMKWQPRYDDFCKGDFTPQTPAEWLGLASVMPLKDPEAYSSVKDRVEQLMDWHKGLKALRAQAAKQSPTIGGLGV